MLTIDDITDIVIAASAAVSAGALFWMAWCHHWIAHTIENESRKRTRR